MLVCSNSIIIIVTASLANVTINNYSYSHYNYHDENGNENAPVAKPPINKPLTAAGEKELQVSSDCRELLQLVQSTATTPTSIPSTTKEKGA